MATQTPNLLLTKPAGSDPALISVINTNMDIIDNLVTLGSSQTLVNKTLTAPHMTAPVVDSGGQIITAGGLTIDSGDLSMNGTGSKLHVGAISDPPFTNSHENFAATIHGVVDLAGSMSSGGLFVSPISTAGVQGDLTGIEIHPQLGAGSYFVDVVGLDIFRPSVGAGVSLISSYGARIIGGNGEEYNYGLYVSTDETASIRNIALFCAGSAHFAYGVGIGMLPVETNTDIRIDDGHLPARVSGDVYLVWNPTSMVVHRSAIGPAS